MPASLFFGAIGAILIGYGLWRWQRVATMRGWPKVAGRIAKLEEQKQPYTQDGITLHYYVPRIEVTYEVAGTTYGTTRFSLHNFTVGFPGELRELVKGAAAGDSIDVHYDPRSPDRGWILLPSHDGTLVAVILGGTVLSLAVLIAAG